MQLSYAVPCLDDYVLQDFMGREGEAGISL